MPGEPTGNATIHRRMIPILNRSMSSLTRTQGVGDLFRIYAVAERDGLDFNLASIPDSFDEQSTELFDSAWMGMLFDLGFEMAKKVRLALTRLEDFVEMIGEIEPTTAELEDWSRHDFKARL